MCWVIVTEIVWYNNRASSVETTCPIVSNNRTFFQLNSVRSIELDHFFAYVHVLQQNFFQ